MNDSLLQARALVLHDLAVCGADSASFVDVVEDAVTERRWWVEEWPEGAAYVAGQVAQDVQDRLLDQGLRWPACPVHGDTEAGHNLHIEPELGTESWWACTIDGVPVAPLGALLQPETSDPQS